MSLAYYPMPHVGIFDSAYVGGSISQGALSIAEHGFELVGSIANKRALDAARTRLFEVGRAGSRCLLDEPVVRRIVIAVRDHLSATGRLPPRSVAIQAIAFDKTTDANWKVTWHQDVMFPFARPVTRSGFDLPSKKEGVNYARPPAHVLEELLAVRLHLDDCDVSNGPLRVSPGSHCYGVVRSAAIADRVKTHGEHVCVANEGDALLMKPLLLHASSPASVPKRRRVLHLVYHAGNPIGEEWHRAV